MLTAEIRMELDGLLPLVVPLVAAVAARPLSDWLPPRTATWVLTVAAIGLAGAGAVALAVPVLGGALRVPMIAALGHLSPQTVRHAEGTDVLVAVAAAVALAASLGAALCTALRQVRTLLASGRAARALPGGDVLAVIDDAVPDAFALPGRPGRVVVSAGMLALLDPAERRALLAHEHAHLDGRHHLFRVAVLVAVAANPLLWPLKSAVHYTTERWADERAAAAVGDRRQAARAIGKAALAHGGGPGPGHAAALGIGSVIGSALASLMASMRTGPVPRRVAALLRPAPPRRLGLAALTGAILLTSLVAAQNSAADLHQLIEHAQAHERPMPPAVR